jgi:hypothetical protein
MTAFPAADVARIGFPSIGWTRASQCSKGASRLSYETQLMLSVWSLDLDVELQEPIEQWRLPVEMPFDQPGRGEPFASIF